MEQVTIFGVAYYYANSAVPSHVQHRMNFFTGKYGNNLDLSAPSYVRHRANYLLRKFGII